MPITFNQITSNTASVTFPHAGGSVTVVYYPGKITEKTLAIGRGLASATGDTMEEELQKFNELLARLIKWWDVYENDEQTVMFPLQADRLAELPLMFRAQVIKAIVSDASPE